jgi:DNA topoisomerase-1
MSDSEDIPLSSIKRKHESEDSASDSDSDEKQLNQNARERWTTLIHRGPMFADQYIPHQVPLIYDQKEIVLPPACEEVAGFFAQLLQTDYVQNPTFVSNFFKDFKEILKEHDLGYINKFEKCNFTRMHQHFEHLRELKKQMTKEEKLKIKEEKQKIDEEYGWCLLDGKKEKVGNFRIEPPGLFRGRGQHPKTGCLKLRVQPEQVTINIGADAPVPTPPDGHQWGNVIHDNTVTWLAMWKENVNESFKYVFLAATSSLKTQSDQKKFEKARELKKVISNVREWYEDGMKDPVMATRQLATCLYFIDKLALRAGNEKGEDEADTVGCCSLRYEHVTLLPPNSIVFDFLGKDSIRYVNTVQVTPQVFKNVQIFKKEPKTIGDSLFDRVTVRIA